MRSVLARGLLIVAAGTLLVGAPLRAEDAHDARVAPKASEIPVQFVLESEQAVFAIDDAIMLTATLKNNGDRDLIIDAGLMAAQGQYDVLDDSEKAIDSGSWTRERDKEYTAHRVPLRMRRSITRFVSLAPHLGDLARAEGKIRIFLEFCDEALGGDSAKPRCVASNAVIIRIGKGTASRR